MKGNYKTEIILNETTGEKIIQPVITNLTEDKIVDIEKTMITAMKLYDKAI